MFTMNRTMAIGITILAVFVVGCRSSGSSSANDRSRSDAGRANKMAIEDVDWRLIDLRGTPVEPAPAGTRAPQIRLISEGTRVTGYTGVNDFNGSYEQAGNTLHFSPLAMTKRAA